MTPGFLLASYNVLADAYIRRDRYPHTALALLEPERRLPALADRIAALDADLICLQEVEVAAFERVAARLAALGYAGELMLKGGRRPDGCALFHRAGRFDLLRSARLEYRENLAGTVSSGHVAQFATYSDGARVLGVANTHLKWDPPETPPDQRHGERQIRQLLDARIPDCTGWVVCGDFNATPTSGVLRILGEAGFVPGHGADAPTCNANRRPQTIDYICHDHSLRATPLAPPPVLADTPLPGPGEPSDHVPLAARLDWSGAPGPAA